MGERLLAGGLRWLFLGGGIFFVCVCVCVCVCGAATFMEIGKERFELAEGRGCGRYTRRTEVTER